MAYFNIKHHYLKMASRLVQFPTYFSFGCPALEFGGVSMEGVRSLLSFVFSMQPIILLFFIVLFVCFSWFVRGFLQKSRGLQAAKEEAQRARVAAVQEWRAKVQTFVCAACGDEVRCCVEGKYVSHRDPNGEETYRNGCDGFWRETTGVCVCTACFCSPPFGGGPISDTAHMTAAEITAWMANERELYGCVHGCQDPLKCVIRG